MILLERQLTELCDAQPFQTSWAVTDLRDGRRVARHGEMPVPAASTRKVAILMACLRLVAAGRLDLDQALVIHARHQNNDSGCVRFLQPGLRLTLQDGLTLMIVVSDNACTAAIMELIDLDEVNRFSRDAGMEHTRHVASAPASSLLNDPTPACLEAINTTTANDMCGLLAAITHGSRDDRAAARLGCTTALCHLALEIMAGQQFRCGLPRLLPTGTKVAHKTGKGPSNESDAGILYRDAEPILAIAVYTHHIPVELADGRPGRVAAAECIAGVAAICWRSA